jgi:hypothetical protein
LIILVNIWIVAPFFHDHALGRPQINPRAALRSRSGGWRCCACRDRLAFVIEETETAVIPRSPPIDCGNGEYRSMNSETLAPSGMSPLSMPTRNAQVGKMSIGPPAVRIRTMSIGVRNDQR